MRWPWSKAKSNPKSKSEETQTRDQQADPKAPIETVEQPQGDPAPGATAKESPNMSHADTPESHEAQSLQPVEPVAVENPPNSQNPEPAEGATADVERRIVEALKTVYDPEIPVDIYELGLIYEVTVRQENSVYVKMTLTSPMCPVAETLPPEVEEKVRLVEGVADVELELVWDPPWTPDMMSEAARLELNM